MWQQLISCFTPPCFFRASSTRAAPRPTGSPAREFGRGRSVDLAFIRCGEILFEVCMPASGAHAIRYCGQQHVAPFHILAAESRPVEAIPIASRCLRRSTPCCFPAGAPERHTSPFPSLCLHQAIVNVDLDQNVRHYYTIYLSTRLKPTRCRPQHTIMDRRSSSIIINLTTSSLPAQWPFGPLG